jgi:predicted DNA-binding transcriptional regulator YafY
MKLHPYSESDTFIRLMLLIATFVHHPGVGATTAIEANGTHDAMQLVLAQMQHVAHTLGFALPDYSVHTLRKDLKTLRQYGILDQRMYRWGYYLGTGALTQSELSIALQALAAQAQGDAALKQTYETVERRLRGLNLELEGQLLYPVRTQLQRSIIYNDPVEMMQQGHYRQTLFDRIEPLQSAILQGLPIELCQRSNPYAPEETGQRLRVYGLQLVYADIAWYLLCEHLDNEHLSIVRLDRLSDHFQILNSQGRGLEQQFQSLQIAHQLLTTGWGLYLGSVEAQQQERLAQLEPIAVLVRFFPPVVDFILEGERRHPTQKVRRGKHGSYVDYHVTLPERSLGEFLHWVNRFMGAAEILAPASLQERHYQSAIALVQRYEN